ncbi:MAG: hypothetical protein ABJ084_10500 [Halioglobus sp.]
MADDSRFTYSITQPSGAPSSGASTSGSSADAELYAFTGCELIDQGDGTTLIVNRNAGGNGSEMRVQSPVATALTYCGTFQTLEQHANMLANTLPPLQGQADNVLAVLTSVKDGGMMLSGKDIIATLTKEQEAPAPLAPTRVFIITCDRPAAVERLLESTLRAGNLLSHDALFLIDDSRDTDNANQNRELVSRFSRNSAKPMLYVGADAQQTILDEIIESAPETEASIRFLIDRQRWAAQPSYGLARNLCLLLSVGYRAIVMDDDALCEGVRSPLKRPGLVFGSGNTREASFYANEQEMLTSQVERITDPLAEQARHLGRTLPEALRKLQHNPITQAALQGANAAFLVSLTSDSPVLITQCGSLGDPGTADSHWVVNLDLASQDRLLDSAGGLSAALENRHSWLGYPQPTICKTAIMSQLTGLDNSQLLPPYFPAFRSEDALFSMMVAYLHPDSAVVNADWAILHLPLENRSDRGMRAPFPARISLALLARVVAESIDSSSPETPDTLLQSLSILFAELGDKTPEDLLELVKQTLTAQWIQQAQTLSHQQQLAPQLHSRNWDLYLQRGLQELNDAINEASVSAWLPQSADTTATQAQLMEMAGNACTSYAQALASWNTIRTAAGDISAKLIDNGSLNA